MSSATTAFTQLVGTYPPPSPSDPLPTTPEGAMEEFLRHVSAVATRQPGVQLKPRLTRAIPAFHLKYHAVARMIATVLGVTYEEGVDQIADLFRKQTAVPTSEGDRFLSMQAWYALSGTLAATDASPTGGFLTTLRGRTRNTLPVHPAALAHRFSIDVVPDDDKKQTLPMPIRAVLTRDAAAQPMAIGVLPVASLLPFAHLMQSGKSVEVKGAISPIFALAKHGARASSGALDQFFSKGVRTMLPDLPTILGNQLTSRWGGGAEHPTHTMSDVHRMIGDTSPNGSWSSTRWQKTESCWPYDHNQSVRTNMTQLVHNITHPSDAVLKSVEQTVEMLGKKLPKTRVRSSVRTVNSRGRGSLRVGTVLSGSTNDWFVGPEPTRSPDRPPSVTVAVPVGGCPACDTLFCNHSSAAQLATALVPSIAAIKWACDHNVNVRVLAVMSFHWTSIGWRTEILSGAESQIGLSAESLAVRLGWDGYDGGIAASHRYGYASLNAEPVVHAGIELKGFREAMTESVLARIVGVLCNSNVTRPMFGQLFELLSPFPQYGNIRSATMRIGSLGRVEKMLGGGGAFVALEPISGASGTKVKMMQGYAANAKMQVGKILGAVDLDAELYGL